MDYDFNNAALHTIWQFPNRVLFLTAMYAITMGIQIIFLSPLCQNIYWESCRLLLFFLIFMKAQQIPNIKGNQPHKGVFLIAELQL